MDTVCLQMKNRMRYKEQKWESINPSAASSISLQQPRHQPELGFGFTKSPGKHLGHPVPISLLPEKS